MHLSMNKLSRGGPALGKQNSVNIQGADADQGLCTSSTSGLTVGSLLSGLMHEDKATVYPGLQGLETLEKNIYKHGQTGSF